MLAIFTNYLQKKTSADNLKYNKINFTSISENYKKNQQKIYVCKIINDVKKIPNSKKRHKTEKKTLLHIEKFLQTYVTISIK